MHFSDLGDCVAFSCSSSLVHWIWK